LLKIRQKLFLALFVLLSIGLLSPTLFINRSIDREVKEEITNTLLSHGRAFSLYLSQNSSLSVTDKASQYSSVTGLRITLISQDGLVLGESGLNESQVSQMDNHLDRPEIQMAKKEAFGVATRYSSTLNKDFIYVAIKADFSPIFYIRVAQTLDFAGSLISLRQSYQYRIIFLVSIVLILFTILVDRWVTSPIRRIAKVAEKIKTGDWSIRSNVKGVDEIADLSRSINDMADTLGTDIAKIIKMSEVRSEFLINVTHELKTPIASISGYIETLLSGALEDEKVNRSFLKRSLKNTRRLEALVTDLVDISRIETGELTMNISQTDIFPIIEELVRDANLRNDNDNIEIRINNNLSNHTFVEADPDRIHQVFNNLISNAIRYTDEGLISINIENKENMVLFSVSDTGVGINKESIHRIFERFYRTQNARSRVKSGTGLGLSIVKHIIEAHGASIKVESEIDKGTTFSFELKKIHESSEQRK